jgi:phenylalanyl-tRNA synthetase beta chain
MMRVLLSWLRELVELPSDVNEVARRLTMAGLEVEKIERLDHGLEKVVVGEVRVRDPIAGTKLSVCRVFDGTQELQIVCGAQNYAAGDHVPVAQVGALLPNGTAIGQAKLRGIESFGMLCSSKELSSKDLDWEDGVDGLMILPRETVPGTPIAQVIGRDEVVFEINVTPNRGDALSHVGVARDLAVLFNSAVKLESSPVAASGTASATIEIAAMDLCSRFTGQVIEGVKIGPSPAWLANRLRALGQRPINNIVDATNYVMLELGQPLHAYDLARVTGARLVARRANAGEVLRTLDGKERVLVVDDLVIADAERPVGLAGVMGGEDSEVKPATTTLLLESAHFLPASIRRTAKRYGLHSEASHRFERGVDPEGVKSALERLTSIILETAGGHAVGPVIDVVAKPFERPVARLERRRLDSTLGVQVPWTEAVALLRRLGLEAVASSDDEASFAIPGYRRDLTAGIDLIEEVARIRGFESIPATILSGAGTNANEPQNIAAERRLRQALSAAGFDEAVNYAFVPAAELQRLRPDVAPIALRNPLAEDQAVMRTTLVGGLLRNVARNLRHGVAATRSYELGRVYLPLTAEPIAKPGDASYTVADERRQLTLVATGPRSEGWTGGKDVVDFYDLKGAVEEILDGLAITAAVFEKSPVPWLHPRSSTRLVLGERLLAVLGELHPTVADAFQLPRGVYVAEFDAEALIAEARLLPRFHGVPRFPASLRDLAVVVDDSVTASAVQLEMRRADAAGLVEDVQLFDVYTGAQLPPGKKNLAFSLRYRSSDRTLTDEEVSTLHASIVERLGSVFGAALRAG